MVYLTPTNWYGNWEKFFSIVSVQRYFLVIAPPRLDMMEIVYSMSISTVMLSLRAIEDSVSVMLSRSLALHGKKVIGQKHLGFFLPP